MADAENEQGPAVEVRTHGDDDVEHVEPDADFVDSSIDLGDAPPDDGPTSPQPADRRVWAIKLLSGRELRGPFDDPADTGEPCVEIWSYDRRRLKNGRVVPAPRAIRGTVPWHAGPVVVAEHFGAGSWYACVRSQSGQILGSTVFETGPVARAESARGQGVRVVSAPASAADEGNSSILELVQVLKSERDEARAIAAKAREREEARRDEELALLRRQVQVQFRPQRPTPPAPPAPTGLDGLEALLDGQVKAQERLRAIRDKWNQLDLLPAEPEEESSGGGLLDQLEQFVDEAVSGSGHAMEIGHKAKELIDAAPMIANMLKSEKAAVGG
jgi:hypothetical protein